MQDDLKRSWAPNWLILWGHKIPAPEPTPEQQKEEQEIAECVERTLADLQDAGLGVLDLQNPRKVQ